MMSLVAAKWRLCAALKSMDHYTGLRKRRRPRMFRV
jgi:hypothetical protein